MSTAAQSELITDLAQVTPAWLTRTLRAAGLLADEQVRAVQCDPPRTTSFSTVVRLHLRYSRESQAPSRLFLKFSLPTRPVTVPERGHEVTFYTTLAPTLSHGPILHCYSAVYSATVGRLHLLLEDVTDTHDAEIPSHLPPIYQRCRQIVAALAQLHSFWWERPPFALAEQAILNDMEIVRRVQSLSARIVAFQDMLGDRLSDQRRRIFRDVLHALPRLFRRLMTARAMSVVHDDVHIGNFLYPRNPDQHGIRIIDWQTWNTDLAVKDLAHMMAYFWFPDQRSRFEKPLLHYYHEQLQVYGIANYPWELLYDDYRLCVIRKLFHPAWQWETGDNSTKWWFHLERVMLAYQDLDCQELLEQA